MIHINTLEIENVKRIKALRLEPSPTGLTVIGGNNGQGKTSVLDAIAWALGGEKFRPSNAQREGSVLPPHLKVTLSNGLVVERKGKNAVLTVTDPAECREYETMEGPACADLYLHAWGSAGRLRTKFSRRT